jgi:undecaprenyl diphosphate synthase
MPAHSAAPALDSGAMTITSEAQTPQDAAAQDALKQRGQIPEHVAIIMDGNGRWAKSQGKVRAVGHREGVESVRDITEACAQMGVRHLTLYTFSTENWGRPRAEVTALMNLLVRSLDKETRTLHDNDIRLAAIGDLSALPEKGRRRLQNAMDLTAGNQRMTLHLALSYSGRWEIVEAARRLAREAQSGLIDPDAITPEDFAARLTTGSVAGVVPGGVPDPDLLIRTGGDLRVSNFLLWQIAYAEIYVTEAYWPAFRREALYDALAAFQDRERRFGKV